MTSDDLRPKAGRGGEAAGGRRPNPRWLPAKYSATRSGIVDAVQLAGESSSGVRLLSLGTPRFAVPAEHVVEILVAGAGVARRAGRQDVSQKFGEGAAPARGLWSDANRVSSSMNPSPRPLTCSVGGRCDHHDHHPPGIAWPSPELLVVVAVALCTPSNRCDLFRHNRQNEQVGIRRHTCAPIGRRAPKPPPIPCKTLPTDGMNHRTSRRSCSRFEATTRTWSAETASG